MKIEFDGKEIKFDVSGLKLFVDRIADNFDLDKDEFWKYVWTSLLEHTE